VRESRTIDQPEPLYLDDCEIESLNISNLDVAELERRIELATGVPMLDEMFGIWCDCNGQGPTCSCNGYTCTTYTCDTYCNDCQTLCGTYCGSDTGCTGDLTIPIAI